MENNKLNFLRENYKSTKNYIVTWEASYNPTLKEYVYFLYIRYTGLHDTVLFQNDTDYNYLINLYNLFMKK